MDPRERIHSLSVRPELPAPVDLAVATAGETDELGYKGSRPKCNLR
jgi:hypothetical protein